MTMASFVRALNDNFMPCRNAALQSFAATIGLFSPLMIAKKILPSVTPYTCDSHKTVRDSAFKCIQVGIEKLKQHALTLPDQPLTSSQQQQQQQQSSGVQQASKGGAVGDMTSYLGSWAKSISSTTSGDEQKANSNQNQSNGGGYGSNHNQRGNQDGGYGFGKTEKTKSSKSPKERAETKRIEKEKKREEEDEIDALFGTMNMNHDISTSHKKKRSRNSSVSGSPMQLKKPESKADVGSLDDFLNSFQNDLDKQKTATPPSKVITKKKKKKKKKTDNKSAKQLKSKSKDAADDFFDDW